MKRTHGQDNLAWGGTRDPERTKKRLENSKKCPSLGKLMNFHLTMPVLDNACPLSVSTRGIGFILSKVIANIKTSYPMLSNDIPMASMYRTSLAQLEAKINFSRAARSVYRSMSGDHWIFEHQPLMTERRAQLLLTRGINLSQIAFVINSIGHVIVNGVHYEPHFISEASPINLRISNLRKYVVKMADLETPADERINGYELNSMPNAIWTRISKEDPRSIVLTNPDEIIPPQYSDITLIEDIEKTEFYLQRVSRMLPLLEGRVDYERDGDPGLLVSTSVKTDDSMRLDERNSVISGFQEREFWSCEPVDRYSWVTGATALAGEVFNSRNVPHRSKFMATRKCDISWSSLDEALSTRYDDPCIKNSSDCD